MLGVSKGKGIFFNYGTNQVEFLRKINFREVAVKQLTCECRLAISQCGPKDCICFEIHLDPVINERLADPCQKKPYLRPIGLPHRN